jgi:hypothetical protein
MLREAAGETKHDAFRRLAEARTNAVLAKLRILANCANPYAYQWTDGDVEEIFEAISREVRSAQLRFKLRQGSRGPFKLATELGQAVPDRHTELDAVTELSQSPTAGRCEISPANAPAESLPEAAALENHVAAAWPDLDPLEGRPVPGREKSQVLVGYRSGRGWRVVAKDKGHKKGYQLLLFEPTSDHTEPSEVVNTEPGCRRAAAVETAKNLIRERQAFGDGSS